MKALLAALLLAAPAFAQDLDAAGFEREMVGRTFFYSRDGQPFGAEQYLPGRRVIWAFTGEDCLKGYWYGVTGGICFVYEDSPDPHCWRFRRTPEGIAAWLLDDETAPPLIARRSSPGPMACLGPDVGV